MNIPIILSIFISFFLLGCAPKDTSGESGNPEETSHPEGDEGNDGSTVGGGNGRGGSSRGEHRNFGTSISQGKGNPLVRPFTSGSTPNTSTPLSTAYHTLHITKEALNDIQTYIANQDLMRGGSLFGYIRNKEVFIEYFLYDYGGKASSGWNEIGKNIDIHLATALAYLDEKNHRHENFLGNIHSKPGSMNYVLSQNDDTIDQFFAQNPGWPTAYVLPIVTRGSETMKTVLSNELALKGDAKISFFAKLPNESSRQIGKIDAYKSPVNYKRMNSFIVAQSLLSDYAKKSGLTMARNVLTRFNGRSAPDNNHWTFDIEIPLKCTIQMRIDWSFPESAPTLSCFKGTAKTATLTANPWVLNTKDFSNFDTFFSNFKTNNCN